MADDGFVKGFTVHEEEAGFRLGFQGDAGAGAMEYCEVAFLGDLVAVNGDGSI